MGGMGVTLPLLPFLGGGGEMLFDGYCYKSIRWAVMIEKPW